MFPGSMTETRPLAEFKRLKMVALFIWRTEFKNKDVIEFCGSKGIKREYSNARTPQQNGVAKRKTMTLIEAARTMLADSFLPNTFWAEAVILLVILKRQEKDANKAAEALRKEFAQETENLIIQAGAAKATNISKALEDESWVDAMQEELLQFNIQKVWILVDLPFCKKAIGTKWVYRNKKDERGFVVRNKASIRIFLAFASYMGFIVYQMDVKSAFLYGKIDEEDQYNHSKTKHIAIRHHFIRDAYEKKLIQVLKIHTDDNVADLLTNAFDVSRHMYAKSSAASNESISEASIRSDLLFNDANGIDSLPNQAIFDAIRHLWGMEWDLITDPSPTHTSEVPVEPQTDPSPRPSPSTTIHDSIPESSGGNLGGPSSSDKSLSGNEGEMTLQSVYDLYLSLCAQIPEDTLDYMDTEDAQDVGRTRDVVDEEKENAEDVLSTEDALSTAQQKVSTDKEKVSTDKPIVSTDGSKVSTDKEKDSTDEQNEGTDDQNKGTDDQAKGTDDHTEGGWTTQTTQTPTSTIFGDDKTIVQVLLNMSQTKVVSREKEKGVEFKDIEETESPRPTSTRSLLTLKPLPKIDPKDKGKK
ncbi:putative ribonuclease H-like domain-containing protein, partial [Tanacetum coccineum]